MEFKQFKEAMQQQAEKVFQGVEVLFETEVGKDDLWNLYLDSFPEGTNEIYRERREFDCSACKQFIRAFGNVVSIKNNEVVSIWDFEVNHPTYTPVVTALSSFVKSAAVKDVFITKEAKFGVDANKELGEDGTVRTWEHFYLQLPKKFVSKSSKSEAALAGEYRDIRNVFKRSLEEISQEATETILELIAQKSLYKGEEWQGVLEKFLALQKEYQTVTNKENYCWAKSVEVGGAVGKIRNHSIGTLLMDVSEGMDLDEAVRRYEKIVAPTNYKRPKAIFTKKMVEQAKKTVEELGLSDSLGRRFATINDITVNNILFANKDAHKQMAGDVFDEMSQEVSVNPKKFNKVEEISIDDFVNNVIPKATKIELLLENKHTPNLVSLIAPQNQDAPTMFKWNNNFSWAYNGNITDSMKERVKAAGGRVDGVLRFTHSWNYEGMRNGSLMDLHVFLPGSTQRHNIRGGKEIHDNYGNSERVGWNHRKHIPSQGVQDVDYVNIAPPGYIPIENITFPTMDRLKEGVYIFKIHNWEARHPNDGGFKAEIAFGGQEYRFERKAPLEHKEWITLARVELQKGEFKILEMMENDVTPINVWGLPTNQFHPVSVCMYSPNYWDGQKGVGHRHYFFVLKGCKTEDQPNGFFNEFLKEELMPHKRVFEALGGKMKVEASDNQLSGVGFSSTKRNSIVCKVEGSFTRTLKINF